MNKQKKKNENIKYVIIHHLKKFTFKILLIKLSSVLAFAFILKSVI